MSKFYSFLTESYVLIGDCRQVGKNRNLPWDDATEMSNDLGYYATFDEWDGKKEDSNYTEISSRDFKSKTSQTPKSNHTYLLRRSGSILIDYDEKKDVHYIYVK